MPKIVFDVADVANVMKVSKEYAYSLFHRDNFPALLVGNKLMARIDRFYEWVENLSKEKKESK